MSTLTDRYVHAALRAVPGRQRADLEPEIRTLAADAIEAHRGDERAALAELGDPAVLGARYADGPQHLIGPGYFAEWRRLLTILLPIVVPLAGVVVLGANLIGSSTIGEAITAGIGTAIAAAIQTVFWVTVVFAAIERFGTPGSGPQRAWSVDDLPELPDEGRVSPTELVTDLVADVILFAAILWLQLNPPIVIDGVAYSLFDPELWSLALPWFLVVIGAQIALTVARFLRGRWTWGFAVANAALNLALVGPALYLLVNGQLFNPALVAAVTAETGDAWLRPTVTITAVVIGAIVAWDTVEGFLRARRASEARSARPATEAGGR